MCVCLCDEECNLEPSVAFIYVIASQAPNIVITQINLVVGSSDLLHQGAALLKRTYFIRNQSKIFIKT